ncbi:MAG: cobalamin biosynthesis protein CobD [[Eubacterium] sulci]|nr:cobalamin biosynthesis protein CobD [[Eubacterium] sulci]
MIFTGILVGAVLLDLLFGDPSWLPHPVVIIGKLIDKLESIMRKRIDEKDLSDSEKQKALRRAGKLLTATVVLATLIFTTAISVLAWLVSPWLFLAVQVFWGFQSLAIKGLVSESKNVYRCLTGKASKTKKKPEEETSHGIKRFDIAAGFESKQDRLVAARKAVGRIVGRDTSELSEEGVTKATVETVAENFADGVLAPLLYLAIGGAPLALTYKAVNTMDSMLGYKNEKYIDFGRASAKLDDFCGFAPARLAALFFVTAAALTGRDFKSAYRIWRRDRFNHASPNSAQTEAACAGALGIRLAGPAYYFGEYYDKPYIGDATREIEAEDILRANKLMVAASLLATACFVGIHLLIHFVR